MAKCTEYDAERDADDDENHERDHADRYENRSLLSPSVTATHEVAVVASVVPCHCGRLCEAGIKQGYYAHGTQNVMLTTMRRKGEWIQSALARGISRSRIPFSKIQQVRADFECREETPQNDAGVLSHILFHDKRPLA